MLTLTKKKMMMITARMSVLAAAVTILFLDKVFDVAPKGSEDFKTNLTLLNLFSVQEYIIIYKNK